MPFDAIERLADAADPKCRKVLEKWKKPLGSHATARFSGAESDDLMLVGMGVLCCFASLNSFTRLFMGVL